MELDFCDLADKCKEWLAAYEAKDYANRGFDWIDNLEVVRLPSTIDELDKILLSALISKDDNVQMLSPDSLARNDIQGFLYDGEKSNSDKHPELELADWIDAIGTKLGKLTIKELSKRRIRVFDSNGDKVDEVSDYECFVFETEMQQEKYILSNGEWFKVRASFDKKITDYVDAISKEPLALPNFEAHWRKKKKGKNAHEENYIDGASKLPELLSFHTKNYVKDGDSVEPCDLLHKDGALVHVKVWSRSATFSHLLAQGAISAELLLHDPKFREHFVVSATKHVDRIKELFPADSFVSSKLTVVFALMRNSSKPLPFFSRLNLMREGERVQRLGYKVKFQRIIEK